MDYSHFPLNNKLYSGAEKKIGITIEHEDYIVKFQKKYGSKVMPSEEKVRLLKLFVPVPLNAALVPLKVTDDVFPVKTPALLQFPLKRWV